jgi:hypothetical protein
LIPLRLSFFTAILIVLVTFFSGCENSTSRDELSCSANFDQIETEMFQKPENLDSLISKIDTSNISLQERARIKTIRGLIELNNENFDKSIKHLEIAEIHFLEKDDQYHLHINKLVKAFVFEYLQLYSNAAKLYTECDHYFDDEGQNSYRFYSLLGLFRLSNQLGLDKNNLVNNIKSQIEILSDPTHSGVFNSALGAMEKNDLLKLLLYENAKNNFAEVNRWSRVYTIEINMLYAKIRLDTTNNIQKIYDTFPDKKYQYSPSAHQNLRYKYAQAYLYAKQGKYLIAIKETRSVLNQAVKEDNSLIKTDCIQLLNFMYRKTRDYEKSLKMLERYNRIKNIETNRNQKSRLLSLCAHYKFTELEKEKLNLKSRLQ